MNARRYRSNHKKLKKMIFPAIFRSIAYDAIARAKVRLAYFLFNMSGS